MTACPSYIGYFAGVDKSVTPNRVIAVDWKEFAYVYSSDGVSWTPMEDVTYTNAVNAVATFTAAVVVPSTPDVSVPIDATGTWTGEDHDLPQKPIAIRGQCELCMFLR
jgi:hypothetical protein